MDLRTSYNILGIDPQADQGSVKRAYKAQVRRWHPDQFREGSSLKAAAEEQLKQINIAYARVKSHVALHRPTPAGTQATNAPRHSPNASSDHEATNRKASRRSWVDHLFDRLNAFAGSRVDDSQTTAGDQANTKQRRTFGQVLDEMTGGTPPSENKQEKTAGQYTRRSYAELYRKYRRQGSGVGGVEPMESKGPVKPVGRVRGIGRNR